MTLSLLFAVSLLFVQDGGLPHSGIAEKDLIKISRDVQLFFDALEVDARSAQEEALGKIAKALETTAKKGRISDSLLKFPGDWDLIAEHAKPEEKIFRSNAGKGFFRYVFADPWDEAGRRVVALLSLPAGYDSATSGWPVVVPLKAAVSFSGEELEAAISAQATEMYSDLLATHVVMLPLGLESGEGRRADTVEPTGSWFAEEGRYVFYTAFRILLERVRFDRARVVLDGWGEAGLDALRLASSSPSFFAGVINRSGGVADDLVILENLTGAGILYMQGRDDGGPEDLTTLTASGSAVEVLRVAGSALRPHAETRVAVAEWIAKQRRDLAPREVRMKVSDLVSASSGWCSATRINRRVTATSTDADFPRFRATFDRISNTIDIETVNVLEMRVFLSDALVDLDLPVLIRVNGKERHKRLVPRSLRDLLENRFFNNSGDYGLYSGKVLIEDIAPNISTSSDP